MAMQTTFSPLSFGKKSFMKIRSAVPENSCLIFFGGGKKTKEKQGGHSSGKPGKPGKVRELKSGQGKVRENRKN